MGKTAFNESVDMRGKTITTFIIFNAVTRLKDMKAGDVIEVITDNYKPIENDITNWCEVTGNALVDVDKSAEYHRYYIKKGTAGRAGKKVTFVISEAGLEELLSPLGFALGFALSGHEVSIFFQGPATRVLKKGFKAKLSGFSSIFSVFARSGLAKAGHIPAQEKVLQLKELGARFYICGPSMDHFGVKESELIFSDITLAEYITFAKIMSEADINFYIQ